MAEELPSYQVAFRRQFHQKLVKHFNEDELRLLCSLHLGINYENLSPGPLSQKILALVEMVERHGRRADLIQACKETNRAGNWEAGGIIMLNMSNRPFTTEQSTEVEKRRGKCVLGVVEAGKTLNLAQDFEPQLRNLIHEHALMFQTSDPEIIINPPPLAAATAILLAKVHAHKGSFPTILRVQPVGGEKWDVAEIIDLGEIRRAELPFTHQSTAKKPSS